MGNGVSPLNKDTLSKFNLKHPKRKTASQDILLNGPLQNIHPVKFWQINREMIRESAFRTKGGLSPSGMDADG